MQFIILEDFSCAQFTFLEVVFTNCLLHLKTALSSYVALLFLEVIIVVSLLLQLESFLSFHVRLLLLE